MVLAKQTLRAPGQFQEPHVQVVSNFGFHAKGHQLRAAMRVRASKKAQMQIHAGSELSIYVWNLESTPGPVHFLSLRLS